MRANDRKLLFEDAGIVTMRPCDVPTYVEHGSADMGITGKDVLLEQSHRNVYELLDLGFGRCRMVVAAPEGGDPIGELRCGASGRVRIATKYPRIAARPLRGHRPPGGDRRGEGIGRAGAADRPGRRHRGPDGHADARCARTACACVEEIEVCTARLIANPVAHKLKAEEIDAIVERVGRDERRSPGAGAGSGRRRGRRSAWGRSCAPCAATATTRC